MSGKKKIIIAAVFVVIAVAGLITGAVFILNRQTYVVSFYSDTKSLLKTEKVKRGDSVAPPNSPQLSYGMIFKKWDKDFSNVTKALDIYPEYEEVDGKKNVFALAGAYSNNESYAFVPLTLSGDVCVSGVQLTLTYDAEKVSLESIFNEDGGIVYNMEQPGKVFINYVSVENTTADVDLCTLKMKIAEGAQEAPISLSVDKIYANGKGDELYSSEYTVIEASVFEY